MRPPPEDIESALRIETEALGRDWENYMDWLNNKPMSHRFTDRELRDGCILAHEYRGWKNRSDHDPA